MKLKFLEVGLYSIFFLVFCAVSIANASIIDAGAYSNDKTNSMYWTNNDLGLDIMRLSYSDTLSSDGGQASYSDINNWLTLNQGWQWVDASQLITITNWFDTDPFDIAWSSKQGIGSSLFFQLMGMSSLDTDYKNGEFDARASWTMESKHSSSSELRAFTRVSDYCDSYFECNIDSPIKFSSGYLTSAGYQKDGRLDRVDRSNAALLVRSINVPEPSTLAIFALGILFIVGRHKLKVKNITIK